MKQLYVTILFLFMHVSWGECARLAQSDSLNKFGYLQAVTTAKDSIPADENDTATVSIVAAILSLLGFVLGAQNLMVVLFFASAALGLTGFIGGIIGLRRRKKIINAKYKDRPDSDIVPVGYTRSYVGLVLGAVMFVASVIMTVALFSAF